MLARVTSVLATLLAATSVLIAQPIASIGWRSVAPGVEHATLQRTADAGGQPLGPFAINALRLDLAQVRLDVVHAMDEAVGLETDELDRRAARRDRGDQRRLLPDDGHVSRRFDRHAADRSHAFSASPIGREARSDS